MDFLFVLFRISIGFQIHPADVGGCRRCCWCLTDLDDVDMTFDCFNSLWDGKETYDCDNLGM